MGGERCVYSDEIHDMTFKPDTVCLMNPLTIIFFCTVLPLSIEN